ncbi:hypothetical protein GCM10010954_16910 [Halobacillus andaensis]|uniref:DUF4397 domain-containing protein n=1 Tax=Halobacillus andaensis TaxID=1176239 RepID=A0A917B4R5_HALAA|nr:DUF4397 domain-containing protein [Halobacillus andaensis]MBP2004808.1 hypothetical protein [Halobacillus andaensis]GGF18722.1 hypothetical protein GCM10010954_16910 [Halobacillus andaensis]
MYHQNADQLAWQAAQYDLMSNYYKYIDPNKHIYYYQKHLECMRQLMNQRQDTMGMNGNSMVRVLHASPDAPAVDIYVNGQQVLQGISYKQHSDYLSVPAGQYQIDIFPEGESNGPVLSQMVEVEPGKMYTVAAAGTVEELQLIAAVDSEGVSPGKAKVRFWHLSPNAPAVDIAVKGGDVLFRNVPFGKSTRYVTLSPTTADLEVRVAGSNDVALTIPDVSLNPNQAYTAVAVGLAGEDPPLEAIFLKP